MVESKRTRHRDGTSRLMEEKTVPLEGGDVILFYTDGITEAMNRSDEVFGYRRLEEIVTRSSHLGADAIKEGVLSGLSDFTRGAPLADDVTLVVAKVKG